MAHPNPEQVLADAGISFEDLELNEQFNSGIRERKMAAMTHLEVESDIIRGIPLQKTLRSFGDVWMKSARSLSQLQQQQRWEQSVNVDHFDVFLSHSWLTSGKWKFLSLLFQSSWHIFLLGWLLAVFAAIPLHLTATMPSIRSYKCYLPGAPEGWDFEGTCDLHAYAHCFGVIGWILGLALAPYMPRFREKTCFLDVVSIHQADEEDMKRGIYAIGGFLAVSSELQLMWDEQYFQRLWCVFEIAAFRTCNPQGKISLRPLFTEAAAVLGIVALYLDSSLVILLFATEWPQVISDIVRACFLLPFTYYLLRLAHQKHQMINELRCAFDREFIYAGISAWYGGSEAFTQYVRGPLADELAKPFSKFRTPNAYWAVVACPLASQQLCWTLAMIGAKAPSTIVLWDIWMRLSYVLLYLTCIKLSIVTCVYFAPWGSCKLKFLKTFFIWFGLIVCSALMFQGHFFLEATSGLGACASGLLILVVFVLFVCDGAVHLCERCRTTTDL